MCHSADTECDARAKVVTAVTMDRGWGSFPKLQSAELDLAVAGEAVFEVVLRAWHIVLSSDSCYRSGFTVVFGNLATPKSKFVRSPAFFPGAGISLAVSGLCHLKARLATSPMIRSNCSCETSPGNGIASSPVPHTAE